MFRLLGRLQSKPEASRKRLGFLLSASLTLIIFVVWVSTLGPRVSSERRDAVDAISPFESIGGSLSRTFKSAMGQFTFERDGSEMGPSSAEGTLPPLIFESATPTGVNQVSSNTTDAGTSTADMVTTSAKTSE